MIKVLLSGCFGRMGRAVTEAARGSDKVEIIAGVDITSGESTFPVYSNFSDSIETPDVVIDFSHHTAILPVLKYALSKDIPVVIATTGHDEDEMELIEEASEMIPVFFSRNMSIGVNLLIALSRKASEFLGEDFDVEIVEKHHRNKLDAPSGTALMIADAISETRKSTSYVYDRHERLARRPNDEIGIHSVRGGTIIGEHEVIFAGRDEVITISHSAASRSLFASGAIKAAEFIIGKEPELYNMDDLVNEIMR